MEEHCKRIFDNQLREAVLRYPNLAIRKDGDGADFLKGILDIPDDNNNIVGNFLVEIKYGKGFPYRFPDLIEVGGEIPNEADWHKYQDGRCCITVPPDEIIKCQHRISVEAFIEQYTIPYFANHLHRKLTGNYKNGEYAHGLDGLRMYYTELLKTDVHSLWKQYYRQAFEGLKVPCERNDSCMCGSGIKYKKCHLLVFQAMHQIGKDQISHHFNLMFK